jgi:regulator of extracellular matrix RemA (YlzA/DUF370 family)
MYVHLGGELVLATTDLVAVLDARAVPGSAANEEFIRRAQAAGRIRGGGLGPDTKALVVTRDQTVYVSSISPQTLLRRMTHLRQAATAWNAET